MRPPAYFPLRPPRLSAVYRINLLLRRATTVMAENGRRIVQFNAGVERHHVLPASAFQTGPINFLCLMW
jgi:hypothetical protein